MSTELKTLNGYGFDATKLGGLDAQYYAKGRAAHNILDNSDFSIAQAGQNGSHGSTKYVCDRWISWDANATFGNGYITPGSPIDQHVSKTVVDINKTYTAAICFSDGTIKAESGKFANGFGSYALGIYCMKQSDSSDYVTVRLNSGNNIRWVALYEGSYTADTLPSYQPKGYAAELAECQRYYYQTWDGPKPSSGAKIPGIQIRNAIAASRLVNVEFPVAMRITPTITLYTSDFTEGAVRNWNNSSDTVTGVIAVYGSTKGFVPGKEASDFTNGAPYSFHYSASAEL